MMIKFTRINFTFHRISSLFDIKKRISFFSLQQDSLSLTEDSGISESCDDSEEAILTKMKLLARDLEQKLSLDSNLVQEIAQVTENVVFRNMMQHWTACALRGARSLIPS